MGKLEAFSSSSSYASVKKNNKPTLAKAKGNLFNCLEVEEPFAYFNLSQLPLELRDKIFEYMTAVDDIRSATVLARGLCLNYPHGYRDSLRVCDSETQPDNLNGTLALLSTSHQVSKQFIQVLERTTPHHMKVRLNNSKAFPWIFEVDTRFKVEDVLPTSARMGFPSILYRDDYNITIIEGDAHSSIISSNVFKQLNEKLLGCNTMTQLIIHFQNQNCPWDMAYSYESERAVLDSFIKVAETLPSLSCYAIDVGTSCWELAYTIYACRPKNTVAWCDVRMVRFTSEPALDDFQGVGAHFMMK